MAYATRQTLEDAFGALEIVQIADRDGDGEPDAEFVLSALARTDGLIDGYLAGRYVLPLATVPKVLNTVACDIARYFLYEDAAPERVRQAYDDALRWLRDVAAGKFLLPMDPLADGPLAPGPPAYSAPPRVFSAETLARF